MDPTDSGFVAAETPLEDGSTLRSELNLVTHTIVVSAGDDTLEIDLSEGPSPKSIGEAIIALTDEHGGAIDVDRERFASSDTQTYNLEHVAAFLRSARAAVSALDAVNTTVVGETAGPHLWPHGFDVATEWFSDRLVDYDGSEANGQIAMGWYPAEDSYVYVNPWPFRDEYASIELPSGATWNLEGWQGAKLDIPAESSISTGAVTDVGLAVHAGTSDTLGT
jgi:hypothetical protein